eukprot:3595211-Prymnesium_polylepis.1
MSVVSSSIASGLPASRSKASLDDMLAQAAPPQQRASNEPPHETDERAKYFGRRPKYFVQRLESFRTVP